MLLIFCGALLSWRLGEESHWTWAYSEVTNILLLGFFLLATSISITRFLAIGAAKLIWSANYFAVLGLLPLLLLQWLILWYWVPIYFTILEHTKIAYLYEYPHAGQFTYMMEDITSDMVQLYLRHSRGQATDISFGDIITKALAPAILGIPILKIHMNFEMTYWDVNFSIITAFIPNVIRFAISTIFLVCYILYPLRSLSLSALYRIIESDKPIFGVLFSGIAAAAQVASWILKQF